MRSGQNKFQVASCKSQVTSQLASHESRVTSQVASHESHLTSRVTLAHGCFTHALCLIRRRSDHRHRPRMARGAAQRGRGGDNPFPGGTNPDGSLRPTRPVTQLFTQDAYTEYAIL